MVNPQAPKKDENEEKLLHSVVQERPSTDGVTAVAVNTIGMNAVTNANTENNNQEMIQLQELQQDPKKEKETEEELLHSVIQERVQAAITVGAGAIPDLTRTKENQQIQQQHQNKEKETEEELLRSVIQERAQAAVVVGAGAVQDPQSNPKSTKEKESEEDFLILETQQNQSGEGEDESLHHPEGGGPAPGPTLTLLRRQQRERQDQLPGAYAQTPNGEASRATPATLGNPAPEQQELPQLNRPSEGTHPSNLHHNLPAAIAVDEEANRDDMPDADPYDQTGKNDLCKMHAVVFLGGIVVLCATVLLVVFLVFRDNPDALPPSPAPTQTESPSSAPTLVGDYLLDRLPMSTVSSIYEENTPQKRSFEWLMEDPNWRAYSDLRLIQRFALATFYFATGGDTDWNTNLEAIVFISGNSTTTNSTFGWMDHDIHECSWAFRKFRLGYTPMLKSTCALREDTQGNSQVLELIFESIWFPWTGLVGSIPDELFLLSNLKNIELTGNGGLGGTLSPLIGKLSNLENIALGYNAMTGTLPTEVGKCTQLQTLFLASTESSGTKIRGTIPTSIGTLQALRNFNLELQLFTGGIPSEIGFLSNLEEVVLYSNLFEKSNLPTEIGALTSLTHLDIAKTGLTGSIPSEFGLLSSLDLCQLENNKLTGIIPTEFGMLNLAVLDLRSNELSGRIPSEFGTFNSSWPYSLLYLHSNSLTGTIPTELGMILDMEYLFLAFNMLSGFIPLEIAKIPSLVQLHLQDNQLTGSIPVFESTANGFFDSDYVDEYTPFKTFNVSDNLFSGEIPQEMCRLESENHLQFDCSNVLCGCSCVCLNTTTSWTTTNSSFNLNATEE